MDSATVFSHYLIGEELGRGGMAVVHRAIDRRTEQEVAIKILYEHWTAQSDVVERFWREAEVAQKLKHPHIVSITDYGNHDGSAFITMPYMAGGSLADYFKTPTRVSLKSTANLLKQISRGLDFAHEQGVVHRDLKLANILIDADKRPALADFGIAHLRDATRLTVTGQIAGTPLYMSPEQARGVSDIDHRADLYSLAVMAYLMATGYHPFTGSDAMAILHQHISAETPRPSEVNANLPKALDSVLMRGLSKNRDARHASGGDFAQDFAAAVSGRKPIRKTLVNISAANPKNSADTIALGIGNASESRRRRPLLIAVWLAPLLILALAAFLLTRPDDGGDAPAGIDADAAATQIVAEITQTANAAAALLTQEAEVTRDDRRATLPPTFTMTPTPTVTPSSTITNTPDATRTPIVEPTEAGNARVASAQGAGLRTAPYAGGTQIARLDQGTLLELFGRTIDGQWLETRTLTSPELIGWVRRARVESQINPATLPVTWFENTSVPATSFFAPTSPPDSPPVDATAGLPPPPTGAPTATPPPPPTATVTPRPTVTPTRCNSADGATCPPGSVGGAGGA